MFYHVNIGVNICKLDCIILCEALENIFHHSVPLQLLFLNKITNNSSFFTKRDLNHEIMGGFDYR
jgi:hypothetical protein